MPEDRIDLRYNDVNTPKLIGVGTFGSRSLISHGAALAKGAREIVEKGKALAARQFEVAADDVTFADGNYRVVGTDLSVSMQALIEKRWGEAAHPLNTNVTLDLANAFPSGAHVAEVEIDPQTGAVDIVNYVAADDCGTIYNHKLVEGQLHGGLMQGIGQVFGEHIAYDPDSGQLLSGTFMDYFMPRAHHLPPIALIDCGVPSPANPLGAKGAGEAGATGAVPALANAVLDALKPVNVRETRDAVHLASDLARHSSTRCSFQLGRGAIRWLLNARMCGRAVTPMSLMSDGGAAWSLVSSLHGLARRR